MEFYLSKNSVMKKTFTLISCLLLTSLVFAQCIDVVEGPTVVGAYSTHTYQCYDDIDGELVQWPHEQTVVIINGYGMEEISSIQDGSNAEINEIEVSGGILVDQSGGTITITWAGEGIGSLSVYDGNTIIGSMGSQFGCPVSHDLDVIITPATNIDEFQIEDFVLIKGSTVTFKNTPHIGTIHLNNLTGQFAMQIDATQESTLNLEPFATGIYVLNIVTDSGKVLTTKIPVL